MWSSLEHETPFESSDPQFIHPRGGTFQAWTRRLTIAVAAALAFGGAAQGRSPTPGRIVFDNYLLSTEQIHLFRERPDGSGRMRLTRHGQYWSQPRWSADGRRLLAISRPGLMILSPEGRTLRRIHVAGDVDEPRWSRDGTRIAYLVLHCFDPLGHSDPSCGALWVMHADGSSRRRLSTFVDLSQGFGADYSWSPDGTRIVYVGRASLAVVAVASGRTRLLTRRSNLIEQYPSWSPDGHSILFAKQRAPGRTSDLVVVAPDGSGLHRLPGTRDAFEPRWSPDGRRIAYLVNNLPSESGWRVVVANADGSKRIKVGTSSDYQVLVWSPDSSRVLFIGPRDTFEIARADGRGTPVRIPGGDEPDWGP